MYCLAVLGGPILFVLQAFGQVWYAMPAALAAVPITALTLLMIWRILLWLDGFHARGFILAPLVMGFIWGATVWPGLSMWANDHVTRVVTNLGGDAFAVNWQAAISAPIDEELIKAIGIAVVAVLFRPLLTRPMHGLLLGGFVGLGAQIAEDCLYSTQTALLSPQHPASDTIIVALLRLITAFTSHWAMSALAGVGIVVLMSRTDRPWSWRLGMFAMFYLLAVAMHVIFDAPHPPGPGLLVIFLPVLVDAAIFTIAYRWVLGTERQWFRGVIALPAARALGPEANLSALLTAGGRRNARAALRYSLRMSRGQAKRYERDLLARLEALPLAEQPQG
ncbi:PrsW family glutamic-type intramembrane protease [Nocardia sp. NPDC088792]|uniref:PrsW family glutamic-type intramembrane protease n=1 Tax=Nocardia sp. NPDC088792 TaxID=3364332 RepID=UPI00380EF1DE